MMRRNLNRSIIISETSCCICSETNDDTNGRYDRNDRNGVYDRMRIGRNDDRNVCVQCMLKIKDQIDRYSLPLYNQPLNLLDPLDQFLNIVYGLSNNRNNSNNSNILSTPIVSGEYLNVVHVITIGQNRHIISGPIKETREQFREYIKLHHDPNKSTKSNDSRSQSEIWVETKVYRDSLYPTSVYSKYPILLKWSLLHFFEAKSNQSSEKEKEKENEKEQEKDKEKEQNNPLIPRHLIYLLKSLQRGHVELFDLDLDLDLDLELDQTSAA